MAFLPNANVGRQHSGKAGNRGDLKKLLSIVLVRHDQ